MFYNWFPGHMEKTRQQILQNLKWVDLIIEIVDSRAPFSSLNPLIEQIMQSKKRLIILSKVDLCDPKKLLLWEQYFALQNLPFMTLNLLDQKAYAKVIKKAESLTQFKRDKEKKRGIKPQPINLMVVGVPNVGKSTFINNILKRKIQKVGNQPGVTRVGLWIQISNQMYLYDSPGILWPNIKNPIVGRNLTIINSMKIKPALLNKAFFEMMDFFRHHYQKTHPLIKLINTYGDEEIVDQLWTYYYRKRKKENNFEEIVINRFFIDLRDGKLGNLTFEVPTDFL